MICPGAWIFGHSVGASAALWAESLEPGIFSGIVCYEPVLYDPTLVESLG